MFGKDFRELIMRRVAEKAMSRGKKSFIWRRGVLGFGLPCFLMTAVADHYGFIGGHRFANLRDFLIHEALRLPIWILAGYFFSLRLWKHYNEIAQRNTTL
jgi:hypothetical protein